MIWITSPLIGSPCRPPSRPSGASFSYHTLGGPGPATIRAETPLIEPACEDRRTGRAGPQTKELLDFLTHLAVLRHESTTSQGMADQFQRHLPMSEGHSLLPTQSLQDLARRETSLGEGDDLRGDALPSRQRREPEPDPQGRLTAFGDGSSLEAHPPPSDWTSNTAAARRRPRSWTAVIWLLSAMLCTVITLR
jgi:hypothetical protein